MKFIKLLGTVAKWHFISGLPYAAAIYYGQPSKALLAWSATIWFGALFVIWLSLIATMAVLEYGYKKEIDLEDLGWDYRWLKPRKQ